MRSNPIHIHEPDLNVGAGTINGGAVPNGILTAASLTAYNPNSAGMSATLANPTVPGLQITNRIVVPMDPTKPADFHRPACP